MQEVERRVRGKITNKLFPIFLKKEMKKPSTFCIPLSSTSDKRKLSPGEDMAAGKAVKHSTLVHQSPVLRGRVFSFGELSNNEKQQRERFHSCGEFSTIVKQGRKRITNNGKKKPAPIDPRQGLITTLLKKENPKRSSSQTQELPGEEKERLA